MLIFATIISLLAAVCVTVPTVSLLLTMAGTGSLILHLALLSS